MPKNIAVMGSTGSIGKQTLDVVRANKEKFKIVALAVNNNIELLCAQIKEFNPTLVAVYDESAAKKLKTMLNIKVEIVTGEDGLTTVATIDEVDTVVAAISGYRGLNSTLAAVRKGKNIALANKETLVVAGELFMREVSENNISLLPVDSEHSAIYQALQGSQHNEIKRLLLTASGGPFRGFTQKKLMNVSLSECLAHPNWSMGRKITVDSATLANKGLEVIEAHWLFDVNYDKIKVVVHPQSIVHSLVEFQDGSVLAQMGLPDMKLPIQYALSYPDRWANSFGQLDLVSVSPLTFENPDFEVFPLLSLAIACGKKGGTAPCIFNAANEEAVWAFLSGKIKFSKISRVVEEVLNLTSSVHNPSLTNIIEADAAARSDAQKMISNLL
ncbi:MAG TPA: 1-deoxy-D-xylulose-5-phosphate reductoisomerase [Candidatus Avacidaminococcus intestinavium]|uniref:1-deoxy-D-xylulose 5-phosphate reductoisomerase n=1 Tax=Candidatus Avacidaminococcus intestinavium TaxID=2840684 RepID=A0A9D1MPG8_9FIRM|nr:1-deoxy-D-xylulose-5-phosphate reductoisomerase [Candidatus Avacidaminococcus intestinavium]